MNDGMTLRGGWNVEYNYAVGTTGKKFFDALIEKKIIAPKCSKCGLVMLPPRSFCERCFVPAEEWVEVGREGTIQAFTIVPVKFESLPEPPYAIAYVLLDGADTALVNFTRKVDLSDLGAAAKKLSIGKRVRVVFEKRRKGSITDFHYEPVDTEPLSRQRSKK
jgi:uncharacterized OB-fold protein